jgi:hypothetical protein
MNPKRKRPAAPLLLKRADLMRPLIADCLATDFSAFVKKAWPVLQPNRPLIWSWHYDYLAARGRSD